MFLLLPVGLVVLALGCWGGGPAGIDETKTPPAPDLPKNLVGEWREAGAQWDRMEPGRGFGRAPNRPGASVPAFAFVDLKEGTIAKLPKPTSPFGLRLWKSRLTVKVMKEVAELENLTLLELEPEDGTDEGLEMLSGLKKLTELRIKGEHVTDAVLTWVDGIPNLTHLDLRPIINQPFYEHPVMRGEWKKGATDNGLRHLAGLKNLKFLDLSYSKLTNAGLRHLAGLKGLTELVLDHTKVTDEGLKHLAGLEKLTDLSLGHTAVTDEGLKHLAGLEKLTDLSLGHTAVTDEGLKHLAGLKKLTNLHLGGSKVTSEGAGGLYRRMKNLDSVTISKVSWKRRGPFKEVKGGG